MGGCPVLPHALHPGAGLTVCYCGDNTDWDTGLHAKAETKEDPDCWSGLHYRLHLWVTALLSWWWIPPGLAGLLCRGVALLVHRVDGANHYCLRLWLLKLY